MRAVSLLVVLFCFYGSSKAQDSTTEIVRIALDADIEFVKVYNGQTRVDVHIFEKGFPNKPVEDVLCNLFLSQVSKGGMMGSLITDEKGFCSFVMVNKYEAAKDTIDYYYFICRVFNDKRFTPVNLYKKVYKANLDIKFLESEDQKNKRHVEGILTSIDAQNETIPISNASVAFYAVDSNRVVELDKKINTDMEGKFSYLFNEKLQGDKSGQLNLKVILRHEDYGTVEYLQTVPWGLDEDEMSLHKKKITTRNRILLSLGGVLLLILVLQRKSKKSIKS